MDPSVPRGRAARLFDRIGEDALRAVVADFYDRIFADVIIGFLFEGKDKARLLQREYEFTARFLGADLPYTGRSMPEAHRRVPILGGHFERRAQLLRNVLADHQVDAEVAQAWLDHNEALRGQVTRDHGSECDHELSASRTTVDASNAGGGLTKLGRR